MGVGEGVGGRVKNKKKKIDERGSKKQNGIKGASKGGGSFGWGEAVRETVESRLSDVGERGEDGKGAVNGGERWGKRGGRLERKGYRVGGEKRKRKMEGRRREWE